MPRLKDIPTTSTYHSMDEQEHERRERAWKRFLRKYDEAILTEIEVQLGAAGVPNAKERAEDLRGQLYESWYRWGARWATWPGGVRALIRRSIKELKRDQSPTAQGFKRAQSVLRETAASDAGRVIHLLGPQEAVIRLGERLRKEASGRGFSTSSGAPDKIGSDRPLFHDAGYGCDALADVSDVLIPPKVVICLGTEREPAFFGRAPNGWRRFEVELVTHVHLDTDESGDLLVAEEVESVEDALQRNQIAASFRTSLCEALDARRAGDELQFLNLLEKGARPSDADFSEEIRKYGLENALAQRNLGWDHVKTDFVRRRLYAFAKDLRRELADCDSMFANVIREELFGE